MTKNITAKAWAKLYDAAAAVVAGKESDGENLLNDRLAAVAADDLDKLSSAIDDCDPNEVDDGEETEAEEADTPEEGETGAIDANVR